MATRPKGLRHSNSLPTGMSRHSLRPKDQIFRTKTHARKVHHPAAKVGAHVKVSASNPVLSPPSLRSISLGHSPKTEVVETAASETQIVESLPMTNNFPSPMTRPDASMLSSASSLGKHMKLSPMAKNLLLSTVPGFFGLMGLGHFHAQRRARGVVFLAAGIAISFLSSWYTILPERIIGFVSGGAPAAPYSLSWMSYFTGYNAAGSEYGLMLLALVPAMWAFQVYDSLMPIVVVSPQPKIKASLKIPGTPVMRRVSMTPEEVDAEVRKFAADLLKTRSLLSYLWER